MKILTTAIVYSLMLLAISILGVTISKDLSALLPLPFAIAILSFAMMGRNPELREKCIQTTLIITILLLLGTAGGFIQFLRSVTNPAQSLTTTFSLQAIIFLLSLCYAILAVLTYSKKRSI